MNYFISALIYYVLILPISMLPFFLMYGVSDFLFLIFYYLIPYRRKVVLQNLRNSFPEKPNAEIKKIERRFYRHFCDVILETLKLFSASKESIEKRVKIINPELLDKQFVIALSKSDMLDDELKAAIEKELPKKIPHVFISAVTGKGLTELKDLLWNLLNEPVA